jgi:hypothetical protein
MPRTKKNETLNKKVTIASVVIDIFKSQRKNKLTADQIAAQLKKTFGEKEGRPWIDRVTELRSAYNRGVISGMDGAPKTQAEIYGKDGKPVVIKRGRKTGSTVTPAKTAKTAKKTTSKPVKKATSSAAAKKAPVRKRRTKARV